MNEEQESDLIDRKQVQAWLVDGMTTCESAGVSVGCRKTRLDHCSDQLYILAFIGSLYNHSLREISLDYKLKGAVALISIAFSIDGWRGVGNERCENAHSAMRRTFFLSHTFNRYKKCSVCMRWVLMTWMEWPEIWKFVALHKKTKLFWKIWRKN